MFSIPFFFFFFSKDLMAQLSTAQETKTTARLSERNVVELVSKLKEKGLIGAEENNALLHTVSIHIILGK